MIAVVEYRDKRKHYIAIINAYGNRPRLAFKVAIWYNKNYEYNNQRNRQ